MKRIIIGLTLLAALAFITNPNEKKHKDAVKRELDATLEREFSETGELLSKTFNFKGKAIGTFISRKNKYLYTETVLKLGPNEKVVGYGFFGFVVINRNALGN